MVLNRNPDNFFAETEQVAFCTAHVVPGIDFSNDPLLHGRIHSYIDTQITRLGGPNFHEIPINAPLAPVHNNQRDGLHRQAIPRGRVSYEPNSLGGGCPFQAGKNGFVSFPPAIEQNNTPVDKVRGKPEKFAEHYNQARLFFDSQTVVEKAHIIGGFRFELSKVTVPAIRERMVASLPDAMPRATKQVPKAEVTQSPALSLLALPGDGGIQTRKIAILIADGIESESITTLLGELTAAGAVPRLLASRLGTVRAVDGEDFEVDGTLENSPAVLFDAVVLPDGDEAVQILGRDGHSIEFVKDQYRHGKTILALGRSSVLLDQAGISTEGPDGQPDPGLLRQASVDSAEDAKSFIAAVGKHRHPERDRDPPAV
jgi:catalase